MTSLKERIVYADTIPQALELLQEKGYKPAFMPELVDARLEDDELFSNWFVTRSLRVTGKTKQGTPLVLYIHENNPLATPEGAQKAIKEGLVNGAARIDQNQFESWAEESVEIQEMMSESPIIRVDYNTLKKSSSKVIPVSKALTHPQVIPFLGGEVRAQAYLARHEQVYNTKNIGVWHSDDLNETPVARLLYLDYVDYGGLNSGNDFDYDARFFGVRDGSVADAQKSSGPTLEQLLAFSEQFVPDVARAEFAKGLQQLYKQ